MSLGVTMAPRPLSHSTVRVVALVLASLPYLGNPMVAQELCRNVASVLLVDEETGTPSDVAAVCREALEHRMVRFGLLVTDLDECVAAMARAWARSGTWLR